MSEMKQIGKYFLLEVLGQGAFGKVFKAYDKQYKEYAIKVIDKTQLQCPNQALADKQVESIKREIGVLQQVSAHPYIVSIYNVVQTSNNIYIPLEFCDGGTLHDKRLNSKDQKLAESEVQQIFYELIQAFKYLKEKNIIHRDIKPQNILLHQQKIKIADFGFAKQVQNSSDVVVQTLLGTPFYAALEILQGKAYGEKVDVYSVACVVYELLFGYHPYLNPYQKKKYGMDPKGIVALKNFLAAQEKSSQDPFESNQNQIDPNFQQLLHNMLRLDATKRFSWDQVFNDKYFKIKEEEKKQQDLLQQSRKYVVPTDTLVIAEYEQQTETKLEEIKGSTDSIQVTQQVFQEAECKRMHTLNESNKLFKLVKQYIAFEHNIALLFCDLVDNLNLNEKAVIPIITEKNFILLIFVLIKIGTQCFKNNPFFQKGLIHEKFNKQQNPEKQQQLNNFFTSSFAKGLEEQFEKDKKIIESFNNFYTASQAITLRNYADDELCQQILQLIQKNEDLSYKLAKIVMIDCITNLKQQENQLTKNLCQILLKLTICLNPYKLFNLETNSSFPKYYEYVKKGTIEELKKLTLQMSK